MKNIPFRYLIFALFLTVGMTACNDFEDENYDFSNSIAAYVELSTASIATAPGAEVAVNFRLRTAINNAVVNVGYEITGDVTQSGSVAIEAGDLSSALALTIPTTPVTGAATIKITSVDNGLSIGRAAGGDNVEAALSWE